MYGVLDRLDTLLFRFFYLLFCYFVISTLNCDRASHLYDLIVVVVVAIELILCTQIQSCHQPHSHTSMEIFTTFCGVKKKRAENGKKNCIFSFFSSSSFVLVTYLIGSTNFLLGFLILFYSM